LSTYLPPRRPNRLLAATNLLTSAVALTSWPLLAPSWLYSLRQLISGEDRSLHTCIAIVYPYPLLLDTRSFAAEAAAATADGAVAAGTADAAAQRRLVGGDMRGGQPPHAAKTPSAADPRASRVHAASAGLASVAWLAGRACVVHQRSLVERAPSAALWRRCVADPDFKCACVYQCVQVDLRLSLCPLYVQISW
jgi:hypothetical protein